MKKKYFLVLIAFLWLIATGFGQVKIAELTFETPGGYTTSVAEFSDGGTDYFTRTDGSNIGGAVVLSNIQGSYYFAVQDTDGDGNPTNLILNFNNIDISGYSNLELRIHIAEDDDGSNQDWDATSYMHISGSIDSGASQNLIWIEAAGGTNTEPRLDTTFNGTGNGTAITDTFSQFTNIISGSGNLLDIEIEFNNLRNGDEDIAIDNIEIWGVATTPTPTITATPTTITGLDYSFGNGPSAPQSFDIEGTLLTAGIDITAPTNFEIATSVAGPYNSTVNIPALDANNTNTIYVRLVSGLVQASYSGTITMTNATSGLSSTPTVDVSGEVTAPPPSNNDCSGAISLTPTASCAYVTYTNENTTDSGELTPGCASYNGEDVWFSVIVPASGEITIDTNNIDFTDSGMALYSGTCGSLTLIECDDDGSPNGAMSSITRNDLTPGATVYIRVWEFGGNVSGDFGICVTTPTPCTAPTNQPTNLTFNNITGSSIDGSFSATTADEYLVVVSTSATLGANPVDGVTYNNGDTIGSGTVVQSSNATTFTATGLSQTTQYYFFVFAYNDSSCAGGPAYNTATPLTDDETTITGPCLSTGFESGQPTGWANSDSYYNGGTANSGSQKAGMNSNSDWIRTEQLLNPSDLSFWARASGSTSSYTITIQYSSDNTTWLDHSQILANGSNSGDITNSYQQFNINLNLTGNYYVRWFMSLRTGGSFYLDDVEVFCGTSTPTPELQLVDNTATNQNCGYTIDFGTQSVASNTDLTFDIENVGSADLNITSLNITGNYTIVSPAAPFTVTSGNSQTVTVRFTPSAAGTQTGVLTINNNDIDEVSCTINLTGEGFTPTPDINVEGNLGTFPDIPGDASNTPAGFNNTLFAATTIGNSQSKSFRIVNEGTLNLILSSITLGGSNPGDFTITGTAPANTIAPNGIEILEITFSPLASGTRTATVIINNNDSDENPFVFNIQGTGECNTATYELYPTEGPAGTIVTVTTTSGSNPNDSTAQYNGTSTTITNISATTFEITIPDNAISSDITFDDVTGCSRSLPFTVLDNDITSCEGNGTLPTDIFISEVTDRDSSIDGHSYIELFNGTGVDVDISSYFIEVHHNGSSSPIAYINIPNGTTLVNNDTYVISFGTGPSEVDPVSQNDYFSSNTIGINDEDHLILNDGSSDIDLWGDTSGNPFTGGSGTEYNSSIPNGSNYTHRRSIIGPSLTWNPSDWIILSSVNYSDIGNFDFSVGAPPTVSVEPTVPSSDCNLSVTLEVEAEEGFDESGDTKELTYLWYFSAPGDLGWTQVPSTSPYNGYNTSTLNINDTTSLDGYQYYCQVRENDQYCYTASDAVRINAKVAIWDGTNWSSAPASNKTAILNADYNTSVNVNGETSFEACNLIINDAELIIADSNNGGVNTYVEVGNDLILNGTASILVHPQGAFVQINDDGLVTADNPDNIQVNKRTAMMDNWYEYTYWSSPVFEETIGDALVDASSNRRFKFSAQDYRDSNQEINNTNTFIIGQDNIDDPSSFADGTGYDWQQTNNSDFMTPGVGYASTHDSGLFSALPCNNGPNCQFTYSFRGLFNNGVIEVWMYRNDEETNDNNWNLLGNPYPSAISADAFLNYNADIGTATNRVVDGAIYLWSQNTPPDGNTSGNEVLNFSQSDYAIINGVGETATSAGGDGSDPTNRMIPSGQAFFIAMSDTAPTTEYVSNPTAQAGDIQRKRVVFNNSMRVRGTNDNSQFFRQNTTNTPNKLWLDLTTDNGVFNQILVGYVDNATNGLDKMYFDAPMASPNVNAVMYSIIEGSDKKYTIQGKAPESLTLNEVIPLGFSTLINAPTIYTLTISKLEGEFLTTNTIYVKDKLLNITHNLSETDYTFTSDAGEFNERFEIVFMPEALSIDDKDISPKDLTIIELNDNDVKFTIGANITIEHVEIIDLLGRTLYNFNGNSNSEIYNLSALSQATYLAKVTLSNGQVITKKAVKRK